jgi:superoxide dismutase, Cu-Zn family
MKGYVKPILIAIVAAGGAAYAANQTVTMNVIDAGGIGKEIGALELSDTEAGLRVTPHLAGLPPGDHGFHVHVNPNAAPVTSQTANQPPAWRPAAITIQRTPASTSGHWARAIRGTWQC